MHVNDKKVFAMALVLVALMSIFVTVASADVGTQTWYIRSDATLDKANAGSGSSSVNANGWSSWSAEPAQCALTMPAGTWTLYLNYDSPTCGGEVTVEIWDDAEVNMLAKERYVDLLSGTGKTISMAVNDELNSVDFEATEYFVLWIGWEPDTGTPSLTVNSGSGKSTLASPSADPGYPVPELSSLVLFSVGLLALVGYVAYRRRRI